MVGGAGPSLSDVSARITLAEADQVRSALEKALSVISTSKMTAQQQDAEATVKKAVAIMREVQDQATRSSFRYS